MTAEFVVWFIGAIPAELMYYYSFTRYLKVRNLTLFWILWVISLVPVILCRAYDAPAWLRLTCVFIYQLLMPILLSQDGIPRRILVVVLVNVALMLDEALSLWIWDVLTGIDFAESRFIENLPAYAFVQIVHFVILAFMLYILYLILERNREVKDDAKMRFTIGFPIAQLFLLFVMCSLGTYSRVNSFLAFNMASIMALVFISVDVLYFVSMGRFLKRRQEEQQAVMLQEQVDWCIMQHTEVVASIEEVSRLRHDLRNQMQVLEALSERGDYARAREHLGEVRGRLHAMRKEAGL